MQYRKQQLLRKYRYSANNSILHKVFCKIKQKQSIEVKTPCKNDKSMPSNPQNVLPIQLRRFLWNTLHLFAVNFGKEENLLLLNRESMQSWIQEFGPSFLP